VVQWDQPGSGKSYNAVPKSMLTPERYIEDGLALVKMLRQRFGVEKVTVVGESWGSVLGVWMVQRSPEMFEAFVGAAQMVDFDENDLMCYEFALQWAAERGDTRKIATLKAQGPPPYYGNDVAQKQLTYLADTFAYMNQDVNIINGFNTPRDLGSPEYGLADKVAWALGPVFTLNAVYPQLWDVDLRAQAAELEVPVYFFTGRHDVNAPPALVEEYYQVLDAPHKEIVYFEHSGHNPWVSEADLFVEELLARVPRTSEAATAAVE
jgi:pimeloyl-ACP methyl ester carboxylesterase